jgi:uncharacterized protein YoxC
MVTILILLSIALIICITFMGIMAWMHFSLEKEFQNLQHTMDDLKKEFSSVHEGMRAVTAETNELHRLNEDSKAMNSKTELLLQSVSDAVTVAKKSSSLALDTIQEIRRFSRPGSTAGQRVIYVNGKPVEVRSNNQQSMKDFKFEEKEDDEEEPRS